MNEKLKATWSEVSVGEIAAPNKNALVGGPFGSNLIQRDYRPSGVPVIRGQNMGLGRWVSGEFVFVSEEKAQQLSPNSARPGDLVFTQRGTIGQVAIVPPRPFENYIISQSQMKLTVDSTKADAMFLYYLFTSDEQRDYIRRNAIQTGVPHTNLKHLRTTPLTLPPLSTQRAIACVLGTLDDKIELNRRMNETLEAMAQALFKSWFVDPTQNGLPEGWRESTIGEICEFAYGKALKEETRQPGSIPVYGSNGQVGWHHEALVKGPGIVVGRKGNPGIVTWAATDFFPIDTTFYVLPKGECRSLYFLFFVLRAQDLASLGADSAVPGLNRNMAYMSETVIPPTNLLEAFDSKVRPMFECIQNNEEESRTLAALRDALLPKMLSGEVRFQEAGEACS
jgi:type I restriction enzyme S subunit